MKKVVRIMTKWRRSIAVNIISTVVSLLVLLAVIASVLGYISFTESFKREYSESTYHMADTATALINGDNIDNYLAGKEQAEYRKTKQHLDTFCTKMNVTLLYLIKVDTSDYGRFESIFNSVNNSVGNEEYTPWELGHKQDTSSDEYREKYEALYNKESDYETVYRIDTYKGKYPHITTMVPVFNSKGDVAAIMCLQRPMSEMKEVGGRYLYNIGFSTLGFAILASVCISLYIRRRIVKPIGKVSREATRFAEENTKDEPLGNISKITEIHNLANSIDKMETDMLNYIDNLTAATSEKERIVTELSLAAKIQVNSIPNTFPAFPDRNEFDIFASMTPAKEVGGDFYNFFMIDDDHLALVIGDVSGKGIPASLFMMVTNILLSDRAKMGGTPAEILAYVNDNLCEHNTAEMFVTIWLGILEISTGKVVAANAGHEYPVICRKGGKFELLKDKHGFVVGGMESMRYKDYEFTLSKGDSLFVYTDGVPEANNLSEELFGTERMVDALNKNTEADSRGIISNVKSEVEKFVGDADQFDDLTMLCIRYNGSL